MIELVEQYAMDTHCPCFLYSPLPDSCKSRIEAGVGSACDYLINEGNIRKITIHTKEGKELMSFPLTIGLVGAVFAPILAAVGAMAALLGECTITVEREEEKPGA